MKHNCDIEREIYQLERELADARLNDREWDIQHLESEIRDLETEYSNIWN